MLKITSFGLCPFVQRSIITMNYKNLPYEVKYIDLANKPEWFLKKSPMGKVPILEIGDEVLFESAVINEYIDEVSEGSLLDLDPLERAKERAFIELSSNVITSYFNAAIAKDIDGYNNHKAQLERNLSFLLAEYKGPFFKGEKFSLVDAAAYPGFQRLLLTKNIFKDLSLSSEERGKFERWVSEVEKLEGVKNSVPKNFEADFSDYLNKRESFIHLK